MKSLMNLSIGKPAKHIFTSGEIVTGIVKQSVEQAKLTYDCFEGDGVANTDFHGGRDRAICFYPYEHYQFWNSEWKTELTLPAFGENVTVKNMKEDEVFIGDIYRIGETEVLITQGRIPCATISQYNNLPPLLKRIVETGFTGYFGKVLKEGTIQNGSEIQLLERKDHSISILEANQIYFHDRKNYSRMQQLLNVPDLAEAWKENIKRRLEA
ncbi:MOSC domain-containing protein [Peribacillus alkalitolerans]|uniref:MOSC domain-containing protein n=1 Tax=Peribacillus alkalitolerans TaxID=1550385 RepID=UPI0013D472BF|nr:MOSC domain-containing protein [Peribacillus alkalitolerans]